MRLIFRFILPLLMLFACTNEAQPREKDLLLQADREAPLGWMHLRIYSDSTFEFESRGLRSPTIFKGKSEIDPMQIQFHYTDSVPPTGALAIYNKSSVFFTNGAYPERLGITLTKLDSSVYDEFSIPEIRELMQKAIDLAALQKYFHQENDSILKPLKILEFGLINETTLNGVQKFGKAVSVISQEEAAHLESKNYLSIADWTRVKDKLRLQIYYAVEGITINYSFQKDSADWTLMDSEILEE